MEEYAREPCPVRIIDDCGGAFTMGFCGGAFFQAIKGFRNAPSGFGRRIMGSITAVKLRTPRSASSFAAWGIIFSVVDCSLLHMRHKEDPWNTIISGVVTGGIFSARHGVMAMAGSAIMGGILLSMVEGMSILLTHVSADQYRNAVQYRGPRSRHGFQEFDSGNRTTESSASSSSSNFPLDFAGRYESERDFQHLN